MKRKLLSILLTLCLAFSLLPTAALADEATGCVGGENCSHQAAIGDTHYSTLVKAVSAAKNGETITLLDNVDFTETLIIKDKTITLDLNEKTISNSTDIWNQGTYSWSLISVRDNGNLTITGNGTLKAKENDCYPVDVQDEGAQLTIENGTFIGNIHAVYVETGAAYIKGGTYSVQQKFSDDSKADEFVLNLYDANRRNGTAKLSVSGGTFKAFNPANCQAEAQGTNFCAAGYTTTEDNNTYTVVKGENTAVANAGANYNTLANAISSAASGDTVTLLKDTKEDITIPSGKTITLDLNGHTLVNSATAQDKKVADNSRKHTITNNGTLTILDSVGGGIVDNVSHGRAAIYNAGTIAEIKSGKFTSSADASVSSENDGGNSWYVIYNAEGATISKISGGEFLAIGKYSSLFCNSGTIDEISGGTFTQDGFIAFKNQGTVNKISGGTFASENESCIQNWGTISEVTGGTITAGSIGIWNFSSDKYSSVGKVGNISGGNISGSTAAIRLNDYDTTYLSKPSTTNKASVAVSGGNISGKLQINTNTKFTVSGGYFTSDPTAYLAAGKGLVTSDQSAFAYKVGDKATDVETAVTAGEAVVTIPVGVDGITEDTVKNAAKAANTTKTLTDTVAASGMTNDPAVVGTKEAAVAALSAENISVGSGDTVTVVVQPYLEVNVKSADAGKLTLEISAKYNVVATTDDLTTIAPAKTVTLKSGVPLSINKPIELTIVLPTGFATENSKIYVQHKGYEYTATVNASGATATFINPHGFSTFTVTPTASAVAEVDGTNYTDLQKAVDAVANNGAVKLLNDTSASAVVSRAVKFTLDKNSKSFTGAITAGSGYELSVDGNVYTFTVRSSSGSSGSSSYDPTYSVSTPSKTENGTVTVSPKSASKGDRVTVTVKPDSGYVLETLTVTDKNGNELTLKDKGDGKYTFTMPAGKVEVKATFMEDNSMLNFFYDVPNNAYFYEAVKWAVKNGITTGVGNDLFAPEQPCTRAQIVTFLWRAAGSPEPKGAASGMTDVVSGSYYEKAVAWAIENGITTGTTTSTFSPDATCTRAQAVTFLARALKAKAASAAEFSDVPTGSYFADAVAWAAANGVTEGIGGGLFGSDNDCTRGQIVTFLYRAYNK